MDLLYEDDPNTILSNEVEDAEEGAPKWEDPEKKTGVVYLGTVPPKFNRNRVEEVLSHFGPINRIFLKRRPGTNHFSEGWVEFMKKKAAKEAVSQLHGRNVGGKRRNPAYDTLWCMKYLRGFKWSNLKEQLSFGQGSSHQRLDVEIAQAKRQGHHLVNQIEKAEKMIKKGRKIKTKHRRKVEQDKPVIAKKQSSNQGGDLLNMIFRSNDS